MADRPSLPAPDRAARLFPLLRCPDCGAGLRPGLPGCPSCGREVVDDGGGLDLLDAEHRASAMRFADRYHRLRVREGWADEEGREDPDRGDPRLWQRRVQAGRTAAAILGRALPREPRPVIADVGAGGGWAAAHLPGADVIAFDLLDVPSSSAAALRIRADMRRLPLRDHVLDAVLYTAALHYVPIADAVREAARVLRPDGLLVAVESPIYPNAGAAAKALQRTVAYYTAMGSPELAASYHPIDARSLRAALAGAGLSVQRLDLPRFGHGRLARLFGGPRFPVLVARAS